MLNLRELPPEQMSAEYRVHKLYDSCSPVLECPLCGGSEFRKYGARRFLYSFSQCECGMVFQSKYLTDGKRHEYYKNVYRTCVPPFKNEVTKKNTDGELNSSKRYMRYVNMVPKRHLDIGCSTGSFLKLMKDTHGCESTGVEPGDVFREYSNTSGINTVADICEVEGKYDLITMAHVLEHSIKPIELLETVRGLLDDDGHLFVEVPVLGVAFSHPLLFSEDTLKMMLIKTGFDIFKFQLGSRSNIMLLAKKDK